MSEPTQRVAVKAGTVPGLWLTDKAHKHSFESQRTVNALLRTHHRAAHRDQWVTRTVLERGRLA